VTVTGVLVVRLVCTGNGTHRRRLLRSALLRDGAFRWREPLAEVHAGAVWPPEPGSGRFTLICAHCRSKPRTFRERSLATNAEALAAATHRRRSVEIDLSLLP